MQSNLVSFIQVLRSHDVRISPAETLDAMTVAKTLGYADRTLLRDGLGMTLAKTPEEELVFNRCFDQFFQQSLSDFELPEDSSEGQQSEDESEAGDANPGADAAANAAGDSESLLQQAAAESEQINDLMQSELMQNLVQNNRTELTMAIGQAAAEANLQQIKMFTQKGQFPKKASLPARCWMPWARSSCGRLSSIWSGATARRWQNCSAIATCCASRCVITLIASTC
jgi:uncharacterized protein with von Willebrand factor type A (vWA) domain